MWGNKRWVEFCRSIPYSPIWAAAQTEDVSSPPEMVRPVLSIPSSSLCSAQLQCREEMSQFILWCSNFNILAGNAYFTMWRHKIKLRVFSELFLLLIYAAHLKETPLSSCACPPCAWEYQHWWSQNHKRFEETMRKLNDQRKSTFRLSFIDMILQITFYISSHQFLREFGCL